MPLSLDGEWRYVTIHNGIDGTTRLHGRSLVTASNPATHGWSQAWSPASAMATPNSAPYQPTTPLCYLRNMKSPWKSLKALEPNREYLVLASSIPPRSLSSTWRLFRGSSTVRKQLARTEGVIGFSLLARPLQKQYATLSVWDDEAALDAFAHTSPHRNLMSDLSPEMAPSTFIRWTIRGSDGRPSWREALTRLA